VSSSVLRGAGGATPSAYSPALLHAITRMGLIRHRAQDDQEEAAPNSGAVKVELRKRMYDPIVETGTWVWQMLNGHLNYFAVSGNDKSLWWFCNEVRWRWLKSLKRRSQKAYMSWERFTNLARSNPRPYRDRSLIRQSNE
jgi:hypothetical protein